MSSFALGLGLGLLAVALSYALRAAFGPQLFTHPLVVFVAVQALFWIWYRSRFNQRRP